MYKCVALSLEINDKEALSEAADAYEKILNEVAEENWKLVQIDTLSAESKNGDADRKISKILIFRKNKTDHQTAPSYQSLYCPSCKNEISIDDDYCENCACKLK